MEQSHLPAGKPPERAEDFPTEPFAQGYIPDEKVEPGYETTDFSVRLIGAFAAAAAVIILILLIITWGAFDLLAGRAVERDVPLSPLIEEELAVPPLPRLQAAPQIDMAELYAREEAILSTYGWVDEEEGIVRIPIERAMELVVEEGLLIGEDVENDDAGEDIEEE